MARSARQAKTPQRKGKKAAAAVEPSRNLLQEGAMGLGGLIARNPVLVGGSTAFMVALSYISANALWYQPHPHFDPIMATRSVQPFPEPAVEPAETTIRIERPAAEAMPAPATDDIAALTAEPVPATTAGTPPVPAGDPTVERVQSVLKDLNFYTGSVDGRTGPATRRAVESYQRKIGLPVTGEIDTALLRQLGAGDRTAGIVARPASPQPAQQQPKPQTQKASLDVETRMRHIQAGLRAFGNQGIEIDGKNGGRTRAAIREFQALFGLPETGEPDEAVYAKMKEIGLTN